MPKSRLLIENFGSTECDVAFEPWGAVETLPPGDIFTVEITGPGDGLVEIAHRPDGLIVGAWTNGRGRLADVTVWNKAGRRLRI